MKVFSRGKDMPSRGEKKEVDLKVLGLQLLGSPMSGGKAVGGSRDEWGRDTGFSRPRRIDMGQQLGDL